VASLRELALGLRRAQAQPAQRSPEEELRAQEPRPLRRAALVQALESPVAAASVLRRLPKKYCSTRQPHWRQLPV
jgi:hypothetical protein